LQSETDPQYAAVVFKSKPIDVGMAAAYFQIANPAHFWCRRRFEVFEALGGASLVKSKSLAEIGCGSGVLQRQIEEAYDISVAGFDLDEGALRRNMSCSSAVYCYDIHDRLEEFRGRFDVIFLFDVLEHIADEDRFLESVKFHLTGNGSLAINVPAGQWLFSAYDKVQGHHRRYSLHGLCNVARRNGFAVKAASYWGAPLVPIVLLRKLLLRNGSGKPSTYERGFDPRTAALNRVLLGLSRCEMLPQSLVGTSVMAILERNG